MSIAIVTGSAGLVGAEATRFLARQGIDVVGIDNDMRARFFGPDASTLPIRLQLQGEITNYNHIDADVCDFYVIEAVFKRYGSAISLVVHTAAQPSHDWAAREPFTDFSVNATATLNLLELTRRHAPGAVFIFTSTNKVYGNLPNELPLVELEDRWELDPQHPCYSYGIAENMSIDQSTHSLFGASKIAADVLVQEYGRYFGMQTACFRCGCLTGPGHAGAQLHGFLAYLMKCAVAGRSYTVFGYKGKQVRDNIHSFDVVNAFWQFFCSPRAGAVYNMGGGREVNCSVREAILLCERVTGRSVQSAYDEGNRIGDHIWWISDTRRFETDYPLWRRTYGLTEILEELCEQSKNRGVD